MALYHKSQQPLINKYLIICISFNAVQYSSNSKLNKYDISSIKVIRLTLRLPVLKWFGFVHNMREKMVENIKQK